MCEYCRMPESNYLTVPFPIDHIIARQHGGSTTLDNLALSCLSRQHPQRAEHRWHRSRQQEDLQAIQPETRQVGASLNESRRQELL